MSALKATPGEVVEVGPLGSELATAQVLPLIKTPDIEVLQLVVLAGTTVPTHEFPTEIIVHCLEGWVRVVSSAQTKDLRAGQLLYYSSDEPFSILGVENASLLITAAVRKTGKNVEMVGF